MSLVHTWFRSETFSHCILIPLISAYLIWLKKDKIKFNLFDFSWIGLLLFLLLVVGIYVGEAVQVNFLIHLFVVWLIPAIMLTSFGARLFLAFFFPIAYLTFAVPFGEWLIPFLIDITSWFVMGGLEIIQIPVYREGNYFELTSGSYEVAKACSGIRYTLAAIALGSLFAYLYYNKLKKRILLIAACLVFPIFANGFRALFIVLLAHYTNRELAVGVDHFIYGWIFFGITMFIIFYFGAKFKDDGHGNEENQITTKVLNRSGPRGKVAIFCVSCVILILSYYAQLSL